MSFLAWIKRDKYYVLLAIQVLFLFIMPFIPASTPAAAIFNVVGLSAIMIAGLNLIQHKKVETIGRIVTMLFIALVIFVQFKEFPVLYFFTFVLFFALFVLVDARIILMLINAKEIKMLR